MSWQHGPNKTSAFAAAICASALLSACASTPEMRASDDPFEPANRAVYDFDRHFDDAIVLPIAGLWLADVPKGVQTSVHGVFVNAAAPATFANDVLQARLRGAGETLARFALNTTLGLGGMFDIAAEHGLPAHASDFGQTLGAWGVGEGPFLVWPILGPDPPRDLLGDAADLFLDPLAWLPQAAPLAQRLATTAGVEIAAPYFDHARDMLLRNELGKGSLDPYATMRSIYRQQRRDEISGTGPEK